MKKTGITFIIASIFCLATLITKEQEDLVTDLAFSNIEALAAGEGGGGGSICMGAGSLYCNGGYYKYQY